MPIQDKDNRNSASVNDAIDYDAESKRVETAVKPLVEKPGVFFVDEISDDSIDGFIKYCEELKEMHEQAIKSAGVANEMDYEAGFLNAINTSLNLAHQLKDDAEDINSGKKITIDTLIDTFSYRSSVEFLENEPSQFNYGYTTAMDLFLGHAQNLKIALEKEEQGKMSTQDKTFAYEIGYSAPFTVVQLDIGTEERKNAVSEALKNIINSFGERNAMSEPYKGLLERIKPTTDFLHAFQGGLSCLRYALRNAETDKELCISMLDSIKRSENNLTPVITLKGYTCLPKDKWEDHGLTCSIGQSVDDPSFYYVRVTDGEVTRDYEYDHEPSREEVISDHADKLAEEAIDHYEAEYGADGYRAFGSSNEQEKIRAEENLTVDRDVVSEDDAHLFFEQSNLGEYYEKIRGEGHTGFSTTQDFSHLMINITVSNQRGTKNAFDVTSVGFDTEKQYTVAEFNQALKKANEIWQERWDGLSYPNDTVIVTIENLHTDPCTYRVNLADADFNSIQDIIKLSPTPLHASISTDKAIEMLNAVEHIPQQQDISHKTINSAELSAAKANGQKRSIIMSNKTKLSVSSMTILDEDSSAKAYATVTINDEFAIKNIKVFEGENGLFVTMPSRKTGNEYSDVVFPITKEAREQLNNAVIGVYNDMQSNGQESFMSENTPPEESKSTITASIHPQDYENSHVKGTGQIVIDGAFVVSGVKVIEGNDGSIFASMPSYTNDVDERKDFAFPITKECYEKVQDAVLKDYAYIQNYHEMGGKENLTTAYDLNANFADKLSAELNKNGIENIVKKNDGRANISVKIADKERFSEIRKDLAQTLQQERNEERNGGKKSLSQRIEKAKAQQPEKSAEQAKDKQPHKKPNSQEL